MPQIPLILDTGDTERSRANSLLRDLGIGQKEMAARLADRSDASKGLVGIGDAGSPSMNPLGVGPVSPAPYQQPNNFTPASRAGTSPTAKNPMGL